MGIYDILSKLNINYTEIEHEAVFTVEEAGTIKDQIDGVGCKNLFLTDHQNRFYLIFIRDDKRVDIKAIANLLNCSRLSFASLEQLKKVLNLESGSVTPFGIINDIDNKVMLLIDQDLKENKVLCHPNVNTKTISLKLEDLIKFLEYENISQDITRGIKLPKIPKGHKKDSLTEEQLRQLLNSLNQNNLMNARDCCMINLMLRTGLRSCEVLNANYGDIQTKEGKHILYIQGKGHTEKDDFVVLEYDMMKIIDNYLNKRRNLIDKSPLFISLNHSTYGKRLKSSSFRKIIKNRLRDVGIDSKRLSPHSLRHTAVTFSLLSGATIQETKDMARHTDVNTTLGYAHNLKRLNDSTESKLERYYREKILEDEPKK